MKKIAPILGALGFFAVLMAGGCGQSEAPPAEHYVEADAGGHKLHMLIVGENGPVVVLESGLPGGLGWEAVRKEVGHFARVVTYDRAGYGNSEAGPLPRDGKQIGRELHAALNDAGLSGPYLLVGHSMGGPYIRVFAGMYPQEVMGMVLVDPTEADTYHPMEDLQAWFAAHHPDLWPRVEKLTALVPAGMESMNWTYASSIKEVEEFLATVPSPRQERMRDEFWEMIDGMAGQQKEHKPPEISAPARAEFAGGNATFQEAMAAKLPAVPIILLAAAKPPSLMEFAANFNPNARALQQAMRIAHMNRYQKWVDALPRTKMIITTNSGHGIPNEEPELVIAAIRELIGTSGDHPHGPNESENP